MPKISMPVVNPEVPATAGGLSGQVMPKSRRAAPSRRVIAALIRSALVLSMLPSTTSAQLAPVEGTHYAGRSSETGFQGATNSSGGFSAFVPLNLPTVRGRLPLPLKVIYGGRHVGAAGLGWDVPLSYVFRSATIAHRRPKRAPFFSVTVPIPLPPPVEYSVNIGGERVELVRNASDTAWVGRRGGTQLEVRAEGAAHMILYDGEGRTYTFSAQPESSVSRLANGDLYLLTDIAALGNTVHLSYVIGAPVLPNGNTALSIDIDSVSYNQSPTTPHCFKNKVQLNYDAPPAAPVGGLALPSLSMSMLNGGVLARINKLTSISVKSRSTCVDPELALRDYTFNYQEAVDTRQPQLTSVTMKGRQGTPERNVTLPVAAYSYGSIVDPATRLVTYQEVQNGQPPVVIGAHHYSFGISYTSAQASSELHAPGDFLVDLLTDQALIDLNGDGRPDFMSEAGLYQNTPGPGGTTILSEGTRFPIDIREKIHSSILRSAGLPGRNTHTVVNDTYRQLIDMNGDGRLDVVETVLSDPDHWIIHLNTPDPADPKKSVSVDIRVPVTQMRLALNTTGLTFGRVPLARKTTVPETGYYHCWAWNVVFPGWSEYTACPADNPPPESLGRMKTIVEWELRDVNGDGYPDLVFNASFVVSRDPLLQPASPGAFIAQLAATLVPTDISGSRDIKVLINTAGGHLAEGASLFASPITLEAGGRDGCGTGRWQADPGSATGGILNQTCGFEDINGDGITDRVTSNVLNGQLVNRAALGTGLPERPYSPDAIITLPGPLARTETDLEPVSGFHAYEPRNCQHPGLGDTFDTRRTRGLRDINGDGIPDYIAGELQERDPGLWTVAMGTGTGFAPPVAVSTPVGLELSRERNVCGSAADAGEIAATTTGLYDIDGDGQPEVLNLNLAYPGNPRWQVFQLKPPAEQTDVGTVASVPAAGRLTMIDNGYGAITRIGYKSAKEDTQGAHNLPYPEIVVTAVATTGASAVGSPLLSTTHYAYRDGGLIFDPAFDGFIFPGYERTIELRANGAQMSDGSVATVTDTYGLTPFDSAMDITARYKRYLQAGRTKDVTTLSGLLGADPWALSVVDLSAHPWRRSGAHYEWGARLLTTGPTPGPASNESCPDMPYPYDFVRSQSQGRFVWEDECTKHGFLFQQSVSSWRGEPGSGNPFTSGNTVKTKAEASSVDDFGRTTLALLLNDTSRIDDDQCIRTVYATPIGVDERVLTAPASRTVSTSCDTTTALTLASSSWEYDTSATGVKLPPGTVSTGRVTSFLVSRLNEDTGAPIPDAGGAGTIRLFDATYDPNTGALARVKTMREDGATRAVTASYDSFALVPIAIEIGATNSNGTSLGPLTTTLTRDPLTLSVLSETDPNGVQRGNTRDGFDRVRLSTLAPAGGAVGALSSMQYVGFGATESGGRRITRKVLANAVPLSGADTAPGRTATTFFDALGRVTHTEAALGPDYANQTLILGQRLYDQRGRVQFEADPHPSTESAATAYGVSQFFNTDGMPSCFIRGNGPQAFTSATDEPTERYPKCFSRFFAADKEFVDVRDADSLLAGSPQDGVVHESAYTATGQLLERATYKQDTSRARTQIEDALFDYDRLGHLIRMTRRYEHQPPIAAATTWHFDSLGRVLEIDEPNSPPRFRGYDTWGNLVWTQWNDATGNTPGDRRSINRYDALGRLVHREDQVMGVVDPATVNDFVYDRPFNSVAPPVIATNVLGRMARATSPSSSVSFSYDSFGRTDARVFTDRTANSANVYVEKRSFNGDGSLRALDFLLPDTTPSRDERVNYAYDSAGRARSVRYSYGITSMDLYTAAGAGDIDARGRVRRAAYGQATYTAAYSENGRRLLASAKVASPAPLTSSREFSYQGSGNFLPPYDPAGRERSRLEIRDGNPNAAIVESAYDALGRLGAQSSRIQSRLLSSMQYVYDPLGNILKHGDDGPEGTGDTTATYSTLDPDRICSVAFESATPVTPCNVRYDGRGNIVEEPSRSNGNRVLTYTAGGRTKSIVNGSSRAAFDYDAFGALQRLTLSSANSLDTRRDKHFGELIYRRDEMVNQFKQSVITRSIPGPGGLIATRHGADGGAPWTFAFGDIRGHRFSTDQMGAFIQDVSYRPYGEVAVASGAQPGSPQYTNAQWNGGDALTGLGVSQLGARMYDPVIGRFLSRDPLLIPRTAATTNPYAFAANDPVNHSDPTGLQESDPTGLPPQCDPGVCGSTGPGGVPVHEHPPSGPAGPHTSTTNDRSGPPVNPLLFGEAPKADEDDASESVEKAQTGLESAGTLLTVGAYFLEHGSEAQIFTEWGAGTAHYLNIMASTWQFAKAPSARTGYGVVSAGVDTALLTKGPPGWVAYGAKAWLTAWYDAYAGDSWDKAAEEVTIEVEAENRARQAALAAEQRKADLEYQAFRLQEQHFWQDYWDEVGPTLICAEATVCELPVFGPQER